MNLVNNYSTRSLGDSDQKLFAYNDSQDEDYAIKPTGELDQLVEFFEIYEIRCGTDLYLQYEV